MKKYMIHFYQSTKSSQQGLNHKCGYFQKLYKVGKEHWFVKQLTSFQICLILIQIQLLQLQSLRNPMDYESMEVEIQLKSNQIQNDRDRKILQTNLQLTQLSGYTLSNVYRVLQVFGASSKDKKNQRNQNISVINPKGKFISIWNLTIVIFVYLICFQLSIILCFGPSVWATQLKTPVYFVYLLFIGMMVLDIVINLNKGYYVFGQAKSVMDRSRVVKKYILGQFIIDILCVGLLLVVFLQNHIYINLMQIFTIILLHVKKYKYQQEIKAILIPFRLRSNIFIIVMVFFDIVFLAILAGCIYAGMDILLWSIQYYGNNPKYYFLSNNSLYHRDLLPGNPILQFIYGQSWAFSALTTESLGPYSRNPIQHVYEVFAMISLVILFSYTAHIVVVIDERNKTQGLIQEYSLGKDFNRFMTLKQIRMRTKITVLKFFQLISDYQLKNNTAQSIDILLKLPTDLRILMASEIAFTNRLRFMTKFTNYPSIAEALAKQIKMKVYDPAAVLFHKGEIVNTFDQPQIMFIREGYGIFYFPFSRSKRIISVSSKNKILCQHEFITGLAYHYSFKSIDLCIVLQIPFRVVRSVLKNMGFEESYFEMRTQSVCEIQTSIFNNDRCLICEKDHRQDKCSQVFIKEKIMEEMKTKDELIHQKLKGNELRRKKKRNNQNISKKIRVGEIAQQVRIGKALYAIERVKRKSYINLDSDVSKKFSKYFPSFNI